MAKKIIGVDADICSGCSRCVLACSFKKEGEYSPSRARIRVVRIPENGVYLPVACKHCAKPTCAEACSFDAIRRDEKIGLVGVDPERCKGCGNCVSACPFGAITIDPKKQIAVLCDLCNGDPECVKFCVDGAIRLRSFDTMAEIQSRKYGMKMRRKQTA